MSIRYDWTIEELKELYEASLFELISKSNSLHTKFHEIGEVQVCSLLSIKTGGCPEDCKYCAQSSRYQTSIFAQPMLSHEVVLKEAKKAIERGATRICLGAAWREVRDNKQFEEILRMIQEITALGIEVCCTLGMLKENQAKRLKDAGLYAYNPGTVSLEGQTTATSFVIMDDWVVGQMNTLPSATALSVVAINQSDASKQFSLQPFLGDPIPPLVSAAFSTAAKGGVQAISWAPASVSADPDSHLIYAIDSLPGKIAAIKLTNNGLEVAWKVGQTTTEFTALIGHKNKRILVGTDIPGPEIPGNNLNDFAVWRNAKTGEEIARSPLLPAMTQGTMIQPHYNGDMFFEGQSGALIKLMPSQL